MNGREAGWASRCPDRTTTQWFPPPPPETGCVCLVPRCLSPPPRSWWYSLPSDKPTGVVKLDQIYSPLPPLLTVQLYNNNNKNYSFTFLCGSWGAFWSFFFIVLARVCAVYFPLIKVHSRHKCDNTYILKLGILLTKIVFWFLIYFSLNPLSVSRRGIWWDISWSGFAYSRKTTLYLGADKWKRKKSRNPACRL